MNYSELRARLKPDIKVVLTTHQSPDGDAIGSVLGLYQFLKQMGLKQVNAVVPDPDPQFLHNLPQHEVIHFFSEEPTVASTLIQEAECLFILDYNTPGRTGSDMGPVIAANSTATKILIDHHQQPDEFEFMLSDVEASSTAELIYVFCESLAPEVPITLDIAKCLYTGLITDTGSFKYSATGARTHRIAAKFLELGLDTSRIHQSIYDTNSFHRVKLMGYALSEKLHQVEELPATYLSLSQEELQRFHYQKGDTEGLVNYGLSINGIEVTAFLREAEDGSVKISLRSKRDFDVNVFARAHFNGGGHKNAAGGRVLCSLDEAVELFQTSLRKAWNS